MKNKTFDIIVTSHPKKDQIKEENISNVTQVVLPGNIIIKQDKNNCLNFIINRNKTSLYNMMNKLNGRNQ